MNVVELLVRRDTLGATSKGRSYFFGLTFRLLPSQ